MLVSQWIQDLPYAILKSRLVVLGHLLFGFTAFEKSTCHPDLCEFRLFLVIAAIKRWLLIAFDISQAYPEATLEHPYYIRFPAGFIFVTSDGVKCDAAKVLGNLYGSPPAGKNFQDHRDKQCVQSYVYVSNTIEFMFAPCIYSASIFILCENRDLTRSCIAIMLLQTDDVIFGGDRPEIYESWTKHLQFTFKKISVLGPLSRFYQIDIRTILDDKNRPAGYALSQPNAVRKFCEAHGIDTSKPAPKTPSDPHAQIQVSMLHIHDGELQTVFRSKYGSLIWLNRCNFIEITWGLKFAAPHMGKAAPPICAFLDRIFLWCYHNASLELVLDLTHVTETSLIQITSTVDASLARDIATSVSYAGADVDVAGALVLWETGKVPAVEIGTPQTEYFAIHMGSQRALG